MANDPAIEAAYNEFHSSPQPPGVTLGNNAGADPAILSAYNEFHGGSALQEPVATQNPEPLTAMERLILGATEKDKKGNSTAKSLTEKVTGVPFSTVLDPIADAVRGVTRPLIRPLTQFGSEGPITGIKVTTMTQAPGVDITASPPGPPQSDTEFSSLSPTGQGTPGELPSVSVHGPTMGTTSVGELLNTASGIPGTAIATLGEFGAQNIEQAPDTVALMGSGKVMRAMGVYDALANGVEKVAPGLVYRGGLLPQSKEALNAMDLSGVKSWHEAMDMGQKLLTAGATRKLSVPEQKFLSTLIEQPEMRQVISTMNAEEFPANRQALLDYSTTVPVNPAVPLFDASTIPEKLSLPPKTFTDVAQEAADRLHVRLDRMAQVMGKNPDELSRMTEFNYNPLMYINDRVGIMPTVQRMMKESKPFLKAREELTNEMMASKGRVVEPAGPVSLTMMRQDRLIDMRTLFNMFSADPAITRPFTGMESSALSTGQEAADGFVRMPQSDALGPLSGQMVRKQEAKYINQMTQQSGSVLQAWKDLFASWRFGKVVLNPARYINSFTSHTMMADAAGLPPYRVDIYAKAVPAMQNPTNVWYQEMKEHGAPWFKDAVQSGVGDLVDIHRDLTQGNQAPQNIYEAFAKKFNQFVTQNPVSKKAQEAYGNTLNFFKTALYINGRVQGLAPVDAIAMADDAIFNYDKVPMFVKQARTTALPFVTFTYKAAPQLIQTLLNRPDVLQRYRLFMNSWNALSSETANITPQERKEIEANFPGTIPAIAPFRSATGSPMVYDVANKTPYTEFVPGRHPGGVASPVVGALLRNPLVSEAASQLQGKDIFTGQTFAPPLDLQGRAQQGYQAMNVSPKDQKDISLLESMASPGEARAAHAARAWLPEMLGGGRSQDIAAAVRGKNDYTGEPISPLRAISEIATGKGRSLEEAKMSHSGTFKEYMNALVAMIHQRAKQGTLTQ